MCDDKREENFLLFEFMGREREVKGGGLGVNIWSSIALNGTADNVEILEGFTAISLE